MEFLKDLLAFIMKRKKFWIIPIILVILLVAILIFISSSPAVAPFIYTLF